MTDRVTKMELDDGLPSLECFRQPIEFLYFTHARLQDCCERLSSLGEDLERDDAPNLAAAILEVLENDLPLHLADEEEDLFPLLKRRSTPGDRIFGIVELLCHEHKNDIECGRSLMDALGRISRGEQLMDPTMFRDYVRAYAMLQRRHHIMENNELLPVCIERLTVEDLRELGERMAARRGHAVYGR